MSDESDVVSTVHIDFHNADTDGFVRLNTIGAIEDLARLNIELTEGLRLRASDGEIGVFGSVRKPGPEGVWRLEVNWDEVFREHAKK